jgi:heme iron utilization protein
MKTLQLDEKTRQTLIYQKLAVLSTQDEGFPYLNLVAFATSPDFRHLLFVTDKNTRKYRNLSKNRQVSLLIDNRANNVDDFKDALAITLMGEARDISDQPSQWLSIYLKKHPNLNDFVKADGKAMILVSISDYILAAFTGTRSIHLKEPDNLE